MTVTRSPSFEVERVPAPVELLAVTDVGLGNTTWVAALDSQVLIVDPERDPDPYLNAVADLETGGRRGQRALLVAETHLHADFLSGTGQLVAQHATAVAPAAAGACWAHRPVAGGEGLELGQWRLDVLPTPGHTPEHVAYLLGRSGQPTAVFTGGSLLVGSVARTDLIDPADTDALTRALWRAINRELLSLPDDVLVLPTHGAGSFCSAAGGLRRWTTIGAERSANPLLQADEETFVRAVLDSLGTYPPYFTRLRERNRLGPSVYAALPLLHELTTQDVADLRVQGAVLVDVRAVAEYATGHVPGSLANSLRPQFASWLGWLVADPGTPLVFVVDARTDRRELVRQCLNIGYENLAGSVTVDQWLTDGAELRRTPLVDVEHLGGRRIVDVRQEAEYRAGHIPGAQHIELGRLRRMVPALPAGPCVLMCGHGERAASAASLLEACGRDDVAIARGGPSDWAATTGQALGR